MHSCAQNTELARAATRPHSAWLRRRFARWPMSAAHSAPHAKKATRNARPAAEGSAIQSLHVALAMQQHNTKLRLEAS